MLFQSKSRWGSCDRQELVHLVHVNHSRAFWLLVERHYPAFALHRSWPKQQALIRDPVPES